MSLRRSAYVVANGCADNRIDAARIQEFLRLNGYAVAQRMEEADVIVLNACGLTDHQENAGGSLIRQIMARKKATARLIVGGCLVRIGGVADHGDATFGVDQDLGRLNAIFDAAVPIQDVHANYLLPMTYLLRDGPLPGGGNLGHLSKRLLKSLRILDPYTRRHVLLSRRNKRCVRQVEARCAIKKPVWHIKVSTGCLNTCSFCAVRLSRGRLRSKPVDQIVTEFQEGLDRGCTCFQLTGTDIGAYGRDIGTNLAALLQTLVRKDGAERIDLRNVQPRFLLAMMPEFKEVLASGRIARIASAVESGNDRILRLMGRGYTAEDFRQIAARLNEASPRVCLQTQVIVGFPGETDEEFEDTVRLLDDVRFDLVELYPYRPRAGTPAVEFDGHIPDEVIERRFWALVERYGHVVGHVLWKNGQLCGQHYL